MYIFCVADSDIAPRYVEEFAGDDQRSFIAGIVSALPKLRQAQPARSRSHGVALFAWSGKGWVHVRNRSMRVIGVNERLVFADAVGLWDAAYRTAWSVHMMDSQMESLAEFVKMSREEAREYRRRKLTVIEGGMNG